MPWRKLEQREGEGRLPQELVVRAGLTSGGGGVWEELLVEGTAVQRDGGGGQSRGRKGAAEDVWSDRSRVRPQVGSVWLLH